MGTLGGGQGWRGGPAGESRAASNRQVRDKTRQKLMLGSGSQGENQGRGRPAFSANPGRGEGGRCVSEAAPRPEPWSLDAGVGVSPAATEPHLSPQEHRVLTNPTLSPPTGCPGLGGVPGTLAGPGSHCGRSPPSRYPGAARQGDVVPANREAGPPPGALPGLKGDRPAGCSVLGPLASCCPSPSSGHGHLTLPTQAPGGCLAPVPPPSTALLCVCVRVSLVDTLTRVDTGSLVAIHQGHVEAASAQGEAWSSPPNVRKRRSA